MKYGLLAGLAYTHDWARERELALHQEELDHQAQQNAENQARYWGDKLKFGEAFTSYGKARLKEYTDQTLHDIGTFARSNPDWQTNIATRAQMLQKIDSLSNNDITHQELRVKQNYEQMMKDLSSGEYTTGEMDPALTQYKNYSNFGNPEGDALMPSKEFFYRAPTKFDLNTYVADLVKNVKTQDRIVKNGNMVYVSKEHTPQQIEQLRQSVLFGKYSKTVVEKFNQSVKDGTNEGFKTVQEMVDAVIKGHLGTEISNLAFDPLATANARHSGNGNNGLPYDYYWQQFMSNKANPSVTRFADPHIANLLPINQDGTMTLDHRGLMYMGGEGNNGRKGIMTLPGFANKSIKFTPTSWVNKGKSGLLYAEGTVVVPASSMLAGAITNDKLLDPLNVIKGNTDDATEGLSEHAAKSAYWEVKDGQRTGNLVLSTMMPISNISLQQATSYNKMYNSNEDLSTLQAQQDAQLNGGQTYVLPNGEVYIVQNGEIKRIK